MNRPHLTRHLVHAAPGRACAMTLAAVAHEIAHGTSPQAENASHEIWLFGGDDLRAAAEATGLTQTPSVRITHHAWPTHGKLRARIIAQRLKPRVASPAACYAWSPSADAIGEKLGLAPTSPRGRLTPAADAAWIQRNDRAAIRERWGLSDGSRTPAVLVLSDDPTAADAWHAAQAVAIAVEASTPADAQDKFAARVIMHPSQWRRPEAQAMLDHIGLGSMLIQDAQTGMPWATLPGCDIALVLPGETGDAPRSHAWAEASGQRVVIGNQATTQTARAIAEAWETTAEA